MTAIVQCPFSFVPGHMVEPEDMKERRCSRWRFHLGTHNVVGLRLGRWWLWQHPDVRLRNLRNAWLRRQARHRHSSRSER